MKRLIYLILVLLLLPTSLSWAESVKKSDESRFSGRIEAGVIYGASNSRILTIARDEFAIEEPDSQIDDLGKNHDNLAVVSPIIFYDINYAFRDDLLVYYGSPFLDDNRAGNSLGVEKLFANGSVLDIALFVNALAVWEDPYALGVKRKTTLLGISGLNINLYEIMETNFIFNYTYSDYETGTDISGDNNPLLRREGVQHTFKSGYTFFLDDLQSMALTPSLSYEKNISEGNAYSNDQLGAELSFNYEKDNNSVSISASTEIRVHDTIHPIFNKKLNTIFYSSELFYTRSHLGDSNWYMRIGAGVDISNSNVDFYDHIIFISGITLGYSFE